MLARPLATILVAPLLLVLGLSTSCSDPQTPELDAGTDADTDGTGEVDRRLADRPDPDEVSVEMPAPDLTLDGVADLGDQETPADLTGDAVRPPGYGTCSSPIPLDLGDSAGSTAEGESLLSSVCVGEGQRELVFVH